MPIYAEVLKKIKTLEKNTNKTNIEELELSSILAGESSDQAKGS